MDTISDVLEKIDRKNFVPDSVKFRANQDIPLPIGFGQTISQPYTVKKMLMWLDAHTGDIVLDIGSGSGWTTALLSNIVGPKGMIYAVEKIPELLKFGRLNCKNYKVYNAKFYQSHDDVIGLPEKSPFNRILVSASAESLPCELIDQLTVSGKIVIPVKNDILEITKKPGGNVETITHPGFIFVPLV